jgi:hypothetical protein
MKQSTHHDVDPEVHWTRQLYREFEDISWYHKVGLLHPVIQIADLGARWGVWDPFFRTITLNRRLITDHSWDVVLEVLKHEMAHQYVAEVLGRQDDHAHGEAFRVACSRLGVVSWAAKSAGVLPAKIPTLREPVMTDEDEKLLAKAEKLLALGQSGNEHEALLAMQRVRELYAKYDIDRLRSSRTGVMDSLVICLGRKKTEAHVSMIYSILNKHFYVRVIHLTQYSAKDNTKYKATELLGSRQNLMMAEYVFYFLLKQCEILWLQYKKSTKCAGNLRRSYMLGVLHGFSDKLASQSVQNKVTSDMGLSSAESKTLMVLQKDEINDFVSQKYPRIATTSRSNSRVDSNTFASGKTTGKEISLHKGVTSKAAGLGGYLS